MKKAVVTGAGGFIGHHLVKFLKKKGYWVRGVDIKHPEFEESLADHFQVSDLKFPVNCEKAINGMDEVYNLAADMGGMGFIDSQNVAPLHNSNLINTYTIDAAKGQHVKRYFFSSSVCIYPVDKQMKVNSPALKEEEAYPANPNMAYGWEKLTHEQRCKYYGEEYGMVCRIARFQNTFGPMGTYEGGREKAPAAICRKVALARNGDDIEVWGDGKQTRVFMFIDDNVEGIYKIMHSDMEGPINLGPERSISIEDMTKMIIKISGKDLGIKYVDGPQGVRSRHFDHTRIHSLGWKPNMSFGMGIEKTYRWIESEINKKNA